GAAQGDPDALYNLSDLYYDGQFEAEPERILDLLERAAEAGHAEAQFRLGWIHESGRYGPRAGDRAIFYYERAAEQGHGTALNNLSILLVETRRESENSPRVIELLEKAAEKNNQYALNNLGYRHVYQKFDGSNPRRGIHLLIRSAELGHREAMRNLEVIARDERLAAHFTEAELERWSDAASEQETMSLQAAEDALDAADGFIRSMDYPAALAVLDEHYAQLRRQRQTESSGFLKAIWWDAQTQRGRDDPEWGWRLFDWCRQKYDRDLHHQTDNRLTVRRNQIAGLVEVGRLGLVRETCDGIRALLAEIYGISFSEDRSIAAIAADGSLPGELRFDIRVSRAMAERATWNASVGSMLTNSAAHSLVSLGEERLYAGDWKSAFYYSRWVEHWAETVLAGGDVPNDHPRGWVVETLHGSLLLRARTHELLGDLPAAIEVYEAIIRDGRTPYKGRLTHAAILEASILRARTGGADSVSIADLETLEAEQRANHFDDGQAGEENQLARAWVHQAQGDPGSASALLQSLLQFTEDHERPFLRIAALIAAVEFGLDEGRLNGRETQLAEALELVRRKGLKNIEPRLYELYARFLAADQRLDEAIALQTKAIELLEALELSPRIPAATEALARYFESAGHPMEALAALERLPQAGVRHAEWMRRLEERIAHAVEEAPDRFAGRLDLQPKRITFAPLAGKGGEAVFSLSNLSARDVRALLHIESAHVRAAIETQAGGMRIDLSRAQEGASSTQSGPIPLSASEQTLLRVRIPPDFVSESDVRLRLSASPDSDATTADLVVLPESEAERIHVVNAAEITDNPFYLIPVFHQISNPRGQTAEVSIRTIASEPTRIEAYDAAGQLCFVDAEGNGRFDDPGDLLLTQRIDARFPVFTVGEDSGLIELRYQPFRRSDDGRIEVRVQTRPDAETDWETDVIDWILP
ncbi:MAG: hypothetical protein ACLFVC_09250, partial [Opitutales bacterium]